MSPVAITDQREAFTRAWVRSPSDREASLILWLRSGRSRSFCEPSGAITRSSGNSCELLVVITERTGSSRGGVDKIQSERGVSASLRIRSETIRATARECGREFDRRQPQNGRARRPRARLFLTELKPYSSAVGVRRRRQRRGRTGLSARGASARSNSLSVGCAELWKRRHSSNETRTAASTPLRVTICGPSLRLASSISLKRASASRTGQRLVDGSAAIGLPKTESYRMKRNLQRAAAAMGSSS